MRIHFVPAMLSLLSLLGVACGGATSDVSPESEDALGTAKAAIYDCRASAQTDTLTRIELALGKTSATVTDVSRDARAPGTGKVDTTYAPTSSEYKDATRFVGFKDIVLTDELSRIDLLVSKDLRGVAASGKLWLRPSGPEGGAKWTYSCTKKTKAFTVDPGLSARLSCTLTPRACADENPPGQTCLSDLFVQQRSGDSADLRVTYLDHFGVQVVERKESLGASSSLARSRRAFSGTWGPRAIELDYRAGITYLGTLAVDGQSHNVKCNDLAMLD